MDTDRVINLMIGLVLWYAAFMMYRRRGKIAQSKHWTGWILMFILFTGVGTQFVSVALEQETKCQTKKPS